MDTSQLKKYIAYYCVPEGAAVALRKLGFWLANWKAISRTAANARFKNIHQGKRCFIVGNGPSIGSQNLLSLRGEVIFSVSSGYHHGDYLGYQPRYHCVPQIAYTEKMTKEVVVAWFREMHEQIGDAELFLSHREEGLVREGKVFPGRKVNYICMHGNFSRYSTRLVDITRTVPGVQSVPIMCLMIAMYMGFREIYLLGVDHDSFKTREYKYFFEPTVLRGSMGGVNEDDKILDPLCEELHLYSILFCQYRAVGRIAQSQGIKIFNATAGGALDEFECIPLDAIVKEPNQLQR